MFLDEDIVYYLPRLIYNTVDRGFDVVIRGTYNAGKKAYSGVESLYDQGIASQPGEIGSIGLFQPDPMDTEDYLRAMYSMYIEPHVKTASELKRTPYTDVYAHTVRVATEMYNSLPVFTIVSAPPPPPPVAPFTNTSNSPPESDPFPLLIPLTVEMEKKDELDNPGGGAGGSWDPPSYTETVLTGSLAAIKRLGTQIREAGDLGFNVAASWIRNATRADLNTSIPSLPNGTSPLFFTENNFLYNITPRQSLTKTSIGDAQIDAYIRDFNLLKIDIVSLILANHQLVDEKFLAARASLDPDAYDRIQIMMQDPEKRFNFINRVLQTFDKSTQSPLPFILLFVGGFLSVYILKKKRRKII